MLRMDEINKIRKAFFTHGESRNSLAIRFRRSWDTVNKIVATEREGLKKRGKRQNRKPTVITSEVLDEINSLLDQEVERKVKKKQRYTARVIYNILKNKGIYKGSKRRIEDTVQRLRNERSQSKKQSFIPLAFSLGSSLQIDHGEVDLIMKTDRIKCYLFVASVPGFALRYCQIFPIKSQEAWGEFHERAFRFFGGIFNRTVYDNDSVLIKKVIGSERHQTNFSLSMEEHYGFESHFCNLASGNEKGAVENGVGYCRRNFFPGLSEFKDWSEVNHYLDAACLEDICTNNHYKTLKPLISIFEELKEKLAPLPPKRSWNKSVDCRVDSYQLVTIDRHEYSVPEKYVGSTVRVALGIFEIRIFNDEELIAKHERKYGNDDSLDLNHYLDQLQYKAGAFWDCKAVQTYQFNPNYLEIWRRLTDKHPRKEANRQLVKILLLKRSFSERALLDAIEASLKYGAIDHSAIENILRQGTTQHHVIDVEDIKIRVNTSHHFSWKFDLSPYAELCKEVQS